MKYWEPGGGNTRENDLQDDWLVKDGVRCTDPEDFAAKIAENYYDRDPSDPTDFRHKIAVIDDKGIERLYTCIAAVSVDFYASELRPPQPERYPTYYRKFGWCACGEIGENHVALEKGCCWLCNDCKKYWEGRGLL